MNRRWSCRRWMPSGMDFRHWVMGGHHPAQLRRDSACPKLTPEGCTHERRLAGCLGRLSQLGSLGGLRPTNSNPFNPNSNWLMGHDLWHQAPADQTLRRARTG
jgi:hypothetical protein